MLFCNLQILYVYENSRKNAEDQSSPKISGQYDPEIIGCPLVCDITVQILFCMYFDI